MLCRIPIYALNIRNGDYQLTFYQIISLAAFSVLLSTGQILFKQTAKMIPKGPIVDNWHSILGIPWLWSALLLYGIATILWIQILRTVPLSHAYPFVAIGYILIPLASRYLFDEIFSYQYVLGTFVILIGLAIITFSTNN